MVNNILSSFFSVASRYPNKVAVKDDSGSYTFNDLYLQLLSFNYSIGKYTIVNKRIAIFLPNGIEAVTAIIGVLTSGNCFSILDPSSPDERNRTICNVGEFEFVITNANLRTQCENFFAKERIFLLNELINEKRVDYNDLKDVEPGDAAVMYFTSGSTGIPKAIVHIHGKISIGLKLFSLPPESICDMIIPLGFVASMNLFFTLNSGATICFFDVKGKGLSAYSQFLRDEKITDSMMTVSAFRAIASTLKEGEKLASIKNMSLMGEPLLINDIELFRKVTTPNAIVSQGYGTTETRTISTNAFPNTNPIPSEITAGKPLKGISLYILNDDLKVLKNGEIGQIAVHSPLMATAYYNNDEATKSAFIHHIETNQYLYLTGDLGYLSDEGYLYHKGRADSLVKVRGNRVDLMDIEACILKLEGVRNVVVVNKGETFSETLLVAYCQLDKNMEIQVLRDFVRVNLPDYMIPTFFIRKDTFPLTATGKTNRKALEDEVLEYKQFIRTKDKSQIEYDPLYKQLKKIWMEELKLPRMSSNHCFFNDLGGDSLLAVTVLDRIRNDLNIELPYFVLFRYRTLEMLTEYIHRKGNKMVSVDEIRAPETINDPVIIFIPPVKGGANTYSYGFETYPPNYGLFELTYNIVNESNTHFYTLNELMGWAAEAINNMEHKNVNLYGYSMGGLLAYEIASRINPAILNKLIILDIPPARHKKINLLGIAYNDMRLIYRNILNRNWEAFKINFWHIGITLSYLFNNSTKVRRHETKSSLAMTEGAHLRFYAQFNHSQFNGDMILVRSNDAIFKNYRFNWKKFVKGKVDIVKVKSSHHDLINENVIQTLNEKIVEMLEHKKNRN